MEIEIKRVWKYWSFEGAPEPMDRIHGILVMPDGSEKHVWVEPGHMLYPHFESFYAQVSV